MKNETDISIAAVEKMKRGIPLIRIDIPGQEWRVVGGRIISYSINTVSEPYDWGSSAHQERISFHGMVEAIPIFDDIQVGDYALYSNGARAIITKVMDEEMSFMTGSNNWSDEYTYWSTVTGCNLSANSQSTSVIMIVKASDMHEKCKGVTNGDERMHHAIMVWESVSAKIEKMIQKASDNPAYVGQCQNSIDTINRLAEHLCSQLEKGG